MIDFLFSYETLRLTWWVLLGVLLIGFAVMDGFDLGVGALLPFVAKDDIERRVAINTVGPVWEGNQVWLILGGGAIFAAWPALYALSFSGFYLAMFLVLCALILRPVGFKYRSKKPDPVWRERWDWALFIGGAVPALIFGVAVGNTLQGVPFHFTPDLRPIYEGNLFGLLNPLALYCGIVSLAMLSMHGAAWLAFKADGPVEERALRIGSLMAPLTAALFAGGGVLVWSGLLGGYRVTSPIIWDGPSNPLLKSVVADPAAWLGCRVAGEFPRPSRTLDRASPRRILPASGGDRVQGTLGRADLSCLQARCRHDRGDRRRRDVPNPIALEQQSKPLACSIRCILEPRDVAQHADRDGDLHAPDPGLYSLGLSRPLGEDYRKEHRRRGPLRLLNPKDRIRITMWYFAWILGLGLAASVGILNALWYELRTVREEPEKRVSLQTP